MNRRVVVTHEGADQAELSRVIKSAGMTPMIPARSAATRAGVREHGGNAVSSEAVEKLDASAGDLPHSDSRPATRVQLVALGLSGVLALSSEIVAWTTKTERSPVIIALAVLSVLLGGLPVLKKGLIAVKTFTLNINFLMTVAVIGAAAIGSWPEAAMVLFLFAVEELIEAYSLERARNAVRSLMTLTPDTASVKAADGTWAEVGAAEVAVGSTVRVKPGERIPLDGTIMSGASAVVRTLDSLSLDQILRLAASLDAGSDHPVARAVSAAWDSGKITAVGPLFKVDNFISVPGRGVSGSIEGKTYFVGNHRFAHERGACSPKAEAVLGELEAKGQTTIVLTDDTAALGVLAVADTSRESSVQAVRELHALGVKTIMLSGDNQTTAEVIARSVGIDDARGALLPEDKLKAVKELVGKHGAVGMVGDGVNDAPALAEATIGFAMGAAGTDTALETADVALMRDDLRGVPEFLSLSRRTSTILVQNISFALGAKAVFFVLAVTGVAQCGWPSWRTSARHSWSLRTG